MVERRRRSRRVADQVPGTTGSGIVVDSAGKTILIEGRALDLSPKEYELLRLLASSPGQTFSVQEILEAVWSENARASAADVHQYVHLLRSKIEPQSSQRRWLVTVRGFGYKLIDPNDA
jgi:DNA-binding response OmpR family regulator